MNQGPQIEALVQISYEKFYKTLPDEIVTTLEAYRPLFNDDTGLKLLLAYFSPPYMQLSGGLDFASTLIGINTLRQRIHVSHFFLQHVISPHLHEHATFGQLLDICCNDLQQLINHLSSLYLTNKIPIGHCQLFTDWLREYHEIFRTLQPRYELLLIGAKANIPAHRQSWLRLNEMVKNELKYAQVLMLYGNVAEASKHIEYSKNTFEALQNNFSKVVKASHIQLNTTRQTKSQLTTNIASVERQLLQTIDPMSQQGATLRLMHTLLTFEQQFPFDLAKFRNNILDVSSNHTFNLERLANEISESIEGVQRAAQVTIPLLIIDLKIRNTLGLLGQVELLPSSQAAETILPLLIKLLLNWQSLFKHPDILMKQNIEILKRLSNLLFNELKIIRGSFQAALPQTPVPCYLMAPEVINSPVASKAVEASSSSEIAIKPALKGTGSKRSATRKKALERRQAKAQASSEETDSKSTDEIQELTTSLKAISLEDSYKVPGKIIDIPDEIVDILLKLESAGFHAFIKGGFVRDSLLNISPNDIDIVTNCPVDILLNILKNLVVKDPNTPNLFTSKGIDLTCSSLSMLQEAQQCDLTINALFADRKGHVYDPLGIINDLDKPILEMIGDSEKNLTEDPIRMLRLLKAHFHVTKDIPPALILVLQNHMQALKTIPFGKYMSHIRKLFCTGKACQAWDFLCRNQLLQPLLEFEKSDTAHALLDESLHHFVKAKLKKLDSNYQETKEESNRYQIMAALLLPILVNNYNTSVQNALPELVDNLLDTFCKHFGTHIAEVERRCFILSSRSIQIDFHLQFHESKIPATIPMPRPSSSSAPLKIAPEFFPQFKSEQQRRRAPPLDCAERPKKPICLGDFIKPNSLKK